MLLVEAKASGISIIQEIRRLTRAEEWVTVPINPQGDKVARMNAVVPMFAGNLIYAPERRWSDMVIDEVTTFPRATHDDLSDTVSQAISYMRKIGLAELASEVKPVYTKLPSNSAAVPYDV
jgi:predicted phage terminase large subunit-like protein